MTVICLMVICNYLNGNNGNCLNGNNVGHRIGQKLAFSELGKYYAGVKDFRKGSHHITLVLNNCQKSNIVRVMKTT